MYIYAYIYIYSYIYIYIYIYLYIYIYSLVDLNVLISSCSQLPWLFASFHAFIVVIATHSGGRCNEIPNYGDADPMYLHFKMFPFTKIQNFALCNKHWTTRELSQLDVLLICAPLSYLNLRASCLLTHKARCHLSMTKLCHGNLFRVTGLSWEESIHRRWTFLTRGQ